MPKQKLAIYVFRLGQWIKYSKFGDILDLDTVNKINKEFQADKLLITGIQTDMKQVVIKIDNVKRKCWRIPSARWFNWNEELQYWI